MTDSVEIAIEPQVAKVGERVRISCTANGNPSAVVRYFATSKHKSF